ncbi:uncharacterized protein BP01DRAFT_309185, partial [Aspergillus saccharolyticus JOP 1030-1]
TTINPPGAVNIDSINNMLFLPLVSITTTTGLSLFWIIYNTGCCTLYNCIFYSIIFYNTTSISIYCIELLLLDYLAFYYSLLL